MLGTKCVGDKFETLETTYFDDKFEMTDLTEMTSTEMTDLIHWKKQLHDKKVANIMILSPTFQISHHHKVTNRAMSPTSLSPY